MAISPRMIFDVTSSTACSVSLLFVTFAHPGFNLVTVILAAPAPLHTDPCFVPHCVSSLCFRLSLSVTLCAADEEKDTFSQIETLLKIKLSGTDKVLIRNVRFDAIIKPVTSVAEAEDVMQSIRLVLSTRTCHRMDADHGILITGMVQSNIFAGIDADRRRVMVKLFRTSADADQEVLRIKIPHSRLPCPFAGDVVNSFTIGQRGAIVSMFYGPVVEACRPETMCVIVVSIAAALSAFHLAGFAHGDVKPTNICFEPLLNMATLIDAGSATEFGESVLKVSARYLFDFSGTASARFDLVCLAASIWELKESQPSNLSPLVLPPHMLLRPAFAPRQPQLFPRTMEELKERATRQGGVWGILAAKALESKCAAAFAFDVLDSLDSLLTGEQKKIQFVTQRTTAARLFLTDLCGIEIRATFGLSKGLVEIVLGFLFAASGPGMPLHYSRKEDNEGDGGGFD
jgi:hypothetical protein